MVDLAQVSTVDISSLCITLLVVVASWAIYRSFTYYLAKPSQKQTKFSVLTFNILSDAYSHYLNYCDSQYLNANYRYKFVSKILRDCDADLIGMQEVDEKEEYRNMLNLHQTKYHVLFDKHDSDRPDGLLMAFNTEKFRLYHCTQSRVIKLNNLSFGRQEDVEYYTENQIAHYVFLQCVANPSHIVVFANMHTSYPPPENSFRLKEIAYILNILDQEIKSLLTKDKNKQISLLCTGDLNTLPEAEQFAYLFEGKCSLNINAERTRDASYYHQDTAKQALGFVVEPDENGKCENIRFTNPFGAVRSVYKKDALPKYTNYTRSFMGCLDYIFYANIANDNDSAAKLESVEYRLLEGNQKPYPNESWPSDHTAVFAQFLTA